VIQLLVLIRVYLRFHSGFLGALGVLGDLGGSIIVLVFPACP
jgi:hypothetical protein